MWIHIFIYLNIFLFFLNIHKCQYPNQQSNPNTCQNPRNTALVEQFFNVIFTEFHNTPPVCVCVQMCIDQATYCYPNGCLKRPGNKVETTSNPVNQIQYGTTKSVMFLVDDKQDFDYIFESPKSNSNAEKREMPQNNDVMYTQNPFKELFIKYKKLPKLEMRYNLREQVKNSKASKLKREKLDMLKTKWPANTHFLKGKQLFNKIYKKNNGIRQTKFFISMIPDAESVLEAPTFYKKFITKREDASVNVEALYLYETDAANFSLESLIDNLIVGSLDKDNKDTKEKKNEADKIVVSTTVKSIEHNINKMTNNQGEAKVNKIVKKNPTNENNDTHSVTSEKVNQSTYFEIMTTMSEKIEKQNNLTVELRKRFTEKQRLEKIDKDNELNINVKAKNVTVITENTLATDKLKVTDFQNVQSTIKRFSIPELKTSMKKNKKKRIVRKLF